MSNSIFGKTPKDLDLRLQEAERKTIIAYSDASIVQDIKSAGGRLKKVGGILSLVFGEPAFKEGADALSKVTNVAGEIGELVVDVENEIGINTTGSSDDFSTSGTLHTSHEFDDPHKVNVGTIPDTYSPVPNSGNVYTFIPNRPSDRKQDFMAVS